MIPSLKCFSFKFFVVSQKLCFSVSKIKEAGIARRVRAYYIIRYCCLQGLDESIEVDRYMSGKQLLRNCLRKTLDQLSREEVSRQSENVANSVRKLVDKPNLNIGCYMSMDLHSEIDTRFMLKWFYEQNYIVFLPRCTHTKFTGHAKLRDSHNNDHPHLVFSQVETYDDMLNLQPQGKYQLKEPMETFPAPLPPILDIMIVPGVGFNLKDGSRIGWGAGYYDDFFKRYQLQHNGTLPLLVGVSLLQQITPEIQLEPHDYKMDCIITGDGTIHSFK